MSKHFRMIENYIYLYHLLDSSGNGTFVVLPTFPEQLQETLNSQFNSTNVLARTAPIYSYQYSGPRSIAISLSLHRDMMTQINYGVSNLNVNLGDDYVDSLVNYLQTIALPTYEATSKAVNPPLIGLRFGNEVYIKGVVVGGVTVTSKLPLLANGKYAQIEVSFSVFEVDPYDAQTVVEQGRLRGLSTSLERSLYKQRS